MKTVQSYIIDLLFEQDCVVIPDFGGFIINSRSAGLDKMERFMSPPQKWLAFNELLKSDDGLLSSYISGCQKISREEAVVQIKKFVEQTRKSVKLNESVYIVNLGTFTLNAEQKLQFQPDPKMNFLTESFGMDNIKLKYFTPLKAKESEEVQTLELPAPVYRTLQLKDREYIHEDSKEETSIRPIRKASRLLSVITIFLGVSAFISGLYFYDSNPSTGLSSFNPFSVISHFKQHFPETPKVNPVVVEKKDEAVKAEEITASKNAPAENVAAKEPLVVEKAIITKPETRYYVIAGSFGSEKNADKMRKILKSNGLDQKIEFLFPVKNEKLIKVSAGEFSDETEAKTFSKTVSDKIKQQTWVFKVKN